MRLNGVYTVPSIATGTTAHPVLAATNASGVTVVPGAPITAPLRRDRSPVPLDVIERRIHLIRDKRVIH